MKTFSGFKKAASDAMRKVVKKKEEERKPQKAMDAGARLRRKKQRQEYKAKVSEFIPDELKDHYEIDESSLSRIKSKSDKGGMAVLSATRTGKSSKENKARNKQLDKDIRGRGLPGATKAKGKWEGGSERSHIVSSGKKGKRKFKKEIKKLGKKYDQDAVIVQTKKSATLSATRKGGLGKKKRTGIGKFKPQGKSPEGVTQIKGKTFTYESYLRVQERGKTYMIVANWRGRLVNVQMFFAKFSRPTKPEVVAEIQKIYPGAIVLYFNPAIKDPTKPLLFAGKENQK